MVTFHLPTGVRSVALSRWWGVALLVCGVALTGCGGGSGKGTVAGKVIFGGQPVTAGAITFAPVSAPTEGAEGGARPAIGRVNEDGTFTLTTDDEGDGALIGRHTVVYSPPSAASENPDPKAPVSPFFGLVPKQADIEVKAGHNDVTIELFRPQY